MARRMDHIDGGELSTLLDCIILTALQNGARAAQMEHTILITDDGADILTR
jgi:methionine aminopeptidase